MRTLLLIVLLAFIASLASATRGSISKDLFDDDINDDVKEVENDDERGINEERRRNPCLRKKCHRGETCALNKKRQATCVCTPDCSFYVRKDERYKVCSNKNDTYETECHLDQDHCRCKHKEEGCTQPGVRKIQLEYYGLCKEFKDCNETELIQFPERMKAWFFIVMEELDRRSQMKEYKDLLESAKQDSNHSMAVVWKFCDLDKDPQDRFVSRRELQYMVRTLKYLEHCLMPFLDKCDANDDRKITLVEWGECLEMDHELITDKCHKLSKKRKGKK